MRELTPKPRCYLWKTKITNLWLWQRRSLPRPAVDWSVGSCRCYWAPVQPSVRWSSWIAPPHWPPLNLWYCLSGCAHSHPAISHQLEDNHRRPRKSGPPHHLAANWIQASKLLLAWSKGLQSKGSAQEEEGGVGRNEWAIWGGRGKSGWEWGEDKQTHTDIRFSALRVTLGTVWHSY